MTKAIVLVGLPASGKSYLVDKIREDHTDFFHYSTDEYIQFVANEKGKTYDEVFADTIGEATEEMEHGLKEAINQKRDIIWDQTNMGAKKRAKILRQLKGYTVRCYCYLPPRNHVEEEEMERRLNSRPGKTIPPHIIKSMRDNFQLPTVEEGFDQVLVANIYGVIL